MKTLRMVIEPHPATDAAKVAGLVETAHGKDSDMTENEERAYEEGRRAAYRAILGDLVRGLAGLGVPISGEAALAERMDVVASLRRYCAEYGDNDWPDDLHLGDVLENHLMRDVRERLQRTAEQERADVIAQIDELTRVGRAFEPHSSAAYDRLRRVILAGDHVGLAEARSGGPEDPAQG